MLKLKKKFDLQRDVVSDILRKEASVCRVKEYSEDVDTRILNTERDGSVLYSWKGATGTTRIGKYDPNTKQNKLLYTFDKQVCVSSCSLNKEETLLAVSLAQNTSGQEHLKPISKCLTLLIEIHPINNTKVLKAVDCRVKVQFLHQETDWKSVLESHLLLFTEDGYVDLYHVLLSKQEGYRVVISNPERLSRTAERIVEDFCWVQWDGHTQRLYCLTRKDKFLMRCVQFYSNHSCDTVLELVLELPANAFRTVRCPSSRTESHRLAALHCLLVFMGDDPKLELKIIEWLCDNMNTFESFDQIQEFILASLFRISYKKSLSLDKVLPYSSVLEKKEVSACLLELPGVFCTTELRIEPDFKGKAGRLQGFWSELQWNTERTKCLNAVSNPRYRTSHIQADWDKLRSESKPSSHVNHWEENTKKVLSMVDTWCHDKKLVPLFQEDDHQQSAFIGLTVDKLREHLNRYLPQLGKKKIDSLVVNYVAKLLELIRHMLESAWLKNKLGPHVLCLATKSGPAEWGVFHFMLRILESTRSLCLPLPPGYHTLFAVFAVRCLPHQTFLQYIDHGFLQLTETFVSRLMTDLDNSEANERLKFSLLKRLPEPMEQRIYHMWDHPVSSASISRDYVKTLLEKHSKNKGFVFTGRDKPGFQPEFLPLTYLAKLLSDIESQALNPFEEKENVDARFVEESALMQTLIQLGFEEK
ncbi:gamma-secretase-activating protein isoform 2-T2 [Anableps anableps]